MKCRFLALLLAVAAGCGTYHLAPDGGGDDLGGGGAGGDDGGIPTTGDGGVVPQRACGTTFTFHGAAPTTVSVAGEFNNWDATANKLTGPDSMGDWSATVMLAPGAYAYKVVTGDAAGMLTWQLDPATPYTKFVGGTENSVVEVDDCKPPLLQFKALTKTPDGALHAEVQYVDGSDAAGIDVSTVTVSLDGAAAGGASIDGNGLITVDTTGLAKTKHRLVFHAADKAAHIAVDLHVPFWIEDQPFDFRDGLMYFAFTDRFRNGDPSNDTPTAGRRRARQLSRRRLAPASSSRSKDGYFDALGVRTLWLSPPNAQPRRRLHRHRRPPLHRLSRLLALDGPRRAAALRHARRAQGTGRRPRTRTASASSSTPCSTTCTRSTRTGRCTERRLVQPGSTAAVHLRHGPPTAAATGTRRSRRLHCFLPSLPAGSTYMPDLDYTSYDALTAMIDDALFWAREVDVDGFRVDAVKHFLLTATTRLRGKLHDTFEHAGPLFYTVGETFTAIAG